MFFGRKTLMITFNIGMTLCLTQLTLCSFNNNSYGMIACVLLFIVFFEFSSGTILFLYLAEIMRDRAISVAIFLNWTLSLAMSVAIPPLAKRFKIGYIFMSFAIFTAIVSA